MNDHSLRIYESMLGLLSSADNPTPLVRLNRVTGMKHAEVYAKLEWYNPFGAVKDRVAAHLVRDAEARGVLGPVRQMVEASSGNTAMGLAMVANAAGYGVTTTCSNAIPLEKRSVLRFFGAEVRELDDSLCPAPGAPEGAIALAAEIGARPDWTNLDQYSNQANPGAHYLTTGPEIWRQTAGRVTHFVAGLGTCGTITGTGRFLKQQNPDVKVLGVSPAEGHDIPGVRSLRQLGQTQLYFPDEYDGQVEVDNKEAYALCLRLNQEESIIAGPSSGMALEGALRLIPDEPGVVAVVIFPDNVFKYATSIRRHCPQLFPRPLPGEDAPAGPSASDALMQSMLDNVRRSDSVIDVGELEDLIDDEACLVLDVRSPPEFADERIEGSVNLPLDELDERAADRLDDRERTIVTVCNVGKISLTAVLLLKSKGYRDVRNLMGGLSSWVGEGMPLV